MKFFSGFCLQNEQEIFKDILEDKQYCIAGFSLGAIEALEYALIANKRINTLQLVSPAFFMDKSENFKRFQIQKFKENKDQYIDKLIKDIPFKINIQKYIKKGTVEQLEKLLCYSWSEQHLATLVKKGIKIEVFLGESDKIINPRLAKKFFLPYSTIYFIKKANHLLIY